LRVGLLPGRVLSRALRAYDAGSRKLRQFVYDSTPGIRVAANARIATTARLSLVADGVFRGGEMVVGDGCILSEGVLLIPYGGSIRIGAGTYIGPYSALYGHGGLELGVNCLVASHCVLVPANHGFGEPSIAIKDQTPVLRGITIEDDVWLGTGTKVLDGVRIGRGTVVAAGAVVTRNLPPFVVAAGVPARAIGNRGRNR